MPEYSISFDDGYQGRSPDRCALQSMGTRDEDEYMTGWLDGKDAYNEDAAYAAKMMREWDFDTGFISH